MPSDAGVFILVHTESVESMFQTDARTVSWDNPISTDLVIDLLVTRG